ncbi:hypothetical protein BH23GEM6_BH23GEM6_19410 [soil metagenome]
MAEIPPTGTQVSERAVRDSTGRGWAEWFQILDEAGATDMSHREIVSLLGKEEALSEWWCQMITVAYEKGRGMRKKHERPGGFQISSSKTVPIGVERLFEMWTDPAKRMKWLQKPITIRKATAPRSLRVTWTDGASDVSVNFYGKGDLKSQVSLEHSKLHTLDQAEEMKLFWKGALNGLKEAVETGA